MLKLEKLYVSNDIQERETLCKRLTDQGATIVSSVGEQDSIHIFNSFEGTIFEDCLKKGFRIIGLPCLQETLESGKALPRTPYPVYSRVMEGIVVSSDVVEQKAKLKSYVHQMNGVWADELSGETQYFITNEPGSIHYMWALEYGSNIVQPSWITESWENRTLSNPKSHILPPLHGCVISVTGLSTSTRNTIQNLVTHYGGKYSQQLTRKKPIGRKYVTALAWGVHVVNSNWLYDSINAKGTVDVSRYDTPPEGEGMGESGGGGGSTALYLRSPYSRSSSSSSSSLSSSPYSLSAARSRLGAPILIRRHRTSAGPLFSLPSTHPHQFAQTTQFQGHPLSLSQSSLRHQTSVSQSGSKPPSRTRDKDGRSSMDRYREMIDQVNGLLRVCDDIIDRSNSLQLSNNNNNNINNNINNNNNELSNLSSLINSNLSSNINNIASLYNNLNQLCNSNDNTNTNNNNFNSNNTTTTTTTTTTSTNNTAEANNNNNNDNNKVKESATTTTTNNNNISSNKEENTDIEMESDEEPSSTATPSEQEK